MARGDHDAISNNKLYIDAEKTWNIELSQTDMIWYDLVVNEHEIFPFRDVIIEKFKLLNQCLNDTLEKRFVYFIACRKKVRFSTKRKPKYSFGGKNLYIYIEVGKNKETRRIACPMVHKRSERPKVEVTAKFITFTDLIGDKLTIPVHTFLLDRKINIGVETFVHYVGKTKIPEKRPIDGNHTGLNKILYKISNEENDIFIFYNLFKVMVSATNEEFKTDFIVSNSMTDEIDVEKEGDILEKAFIIHFSSENQLNNLDREIGQFRNNLIEIANNNKIKKINMGYEVDDISEYYKFGSSLIKPKHNHTFSFSIGEGSLTK